MRIIRPVSAGRMLLLFLAIALCCGCDKCGTGTYDDLPALMEALLQAYRPVATGDTIAVWAYLDASDVTGTIHVGVAAYGRSGIGSVYFSTDGGAVTAVSDETINPDTGEYEFVYTIDTTSLADGVHTIGAEVGLKTLDPITIYAANGTASATWYVSTTGNDVPATAPPGARGAPSAGPWELKTRPILCPTRPAATPCWSRMGSMTFRRVRGVILRVM